MFTTLVITGLVGPRTLSFTATGLTGVTSGGVTVTAGTATQVAVNAGNTQTATVGTAVLIPPSVIVKDASGNPVAGVAVTFAVATGGGTVSPTTAVLTNVSGIAAVTSWTLGTAAGPHTLTATATGLTGSPVTFTATGVAGAATQLALTTPPSSTVQSGIAFPQQPVLQLQDAAGNPVSQSGTSVTVAIATGGGTLGGTATVAAGAGERTSVV